MSRYDSVTIFDGFGNSMGLSSPNRDEIVRVSVKMTDAELKFFADTNKQSDIIQHFLNFNPDCKDLALKRMSYELLTMRKNLNRLSEAYRILEEENKRLVNKS